MKKRLLALLLYSMFWLFFFIVARILFLAVQFSETSLLDAGTVFRTFTHGFKLDLSATSYFVLLPVLLTIPALLFPGRWFRIFMKIYSFALIILCSALVIGDAVVYSYWAFRLEFSIMEYLKTPADAAASATTLQIILFIAGLSVISALFIIICNKLINRFFSFNERPGYFIPSTLLLLILAGSLVIPARGGFGIVPLNAGSVYFSGKLFANHAAINLIWNFGHTAVYSKVQKNPYEFTSKEEALKNLDFLTRDTDSTRKVLRINRPNILIIILESFGSYLTDENDPDSLATPRFREYITRGIYFTGMYAAGSRTDKALPAIFSGFPNLPAINVLREPKKTQSMPGIIRSLDSAGYKTSFWYGGNLDFANMKPYMITTGFRERITMEDFDPSTYNSKWGVHDDVLFRRLTDSLSVYSQPFACAVLTLSSHEPFEVPMEPVFKGKDVISMFKNSIYYTDKTLGEFLDKADDSDWWENTLVILMADHCRRNSEHTPVYSEEIFRIPMLWLGGALSEKGTRVEKIGNQADMVETLAAQLGIRSNFPYSKDLLSDQSKSFAFYTYNEGFAFITDTVAAIYDIKLKGNVEERGSDPATAVKYGKSLLQILFDDYLSR